MRCKACNAILNQSEIKWDEEHKMFEELCLSCRQHVYNEDLIDLSDDMTDQRLSFFITEDEDHENF